MRIDQPHLSTSEYLDVRRGALPHAEPRLKLVEVRLLRPPAQNEVLR